MTVQVPVVSEPQAGVVLLPHGGGNPQVSELSAFDMQSQESRANLPFKCSFCRESTADVIEPLR